MKPSNLKKPALKKPRIKIYIKIQGVLNKGGHIYKIKQSKSASQLHPKKTRRIRGNNNIYKLAVKKKFQPEILLSQNALQKKKYWA